MGRLCTFACVMPRSSTICAVPMVATFPGPASRVPSGPVSVTLWNSRPAFSAGESRAVRSAARSSGESRGSS